MLQSIEIKDFALIERLRVDWTAGLNVLTGETGAGKSILMDALNTVLGGKCGPSSIRQGAEKASIEAEFTCNPAITAWLRQQELTDGDSQAVAVGREITKSGSKIRINGTLVNHAIVQDLAQMLLTIHAQHESRTLMSAQSQLEMLDSLGDQSHKEFLDKVRVLYIKRKNLLQELKETQMSEEERLKRTEFVRFQLNELRQSELSRPQRGRQAVP